MAEAFVIKNGTILTMDRDRPSAEAVGVLGDRIVAVGSASMVEDALPRGYRTIDLSGRFCLPGLNEAHNHMIGFGTALGHVEAGFPNVRSIEDIKRNVAERARQVPPGTWIQGEVTTTTNWTNDAIPAATTWTRSPRSIPSSSSTAPAT